VFNVSILALQQACVNCLGQHNHFEREASEKREYQDSGIRERPEMIITGNSARRGPRALRMVPVMLNTIHNKWYSGRVVAVRQRGDQILVVRRSPLELGFSSGYQRTRPIIIRLSTSVCTKTASTNPKVYSQWSGGCRSFSFLGCVYTFHFPPSSGNHLCIIVKHRVFFTHTAYFITNLHTPCLQVVPNVNLCQIRRCTSSVSLLPMPL